MNPKRKTGKRLLYIADSTSVHTQRWLQYFVEHEYTVYLITIGRKRQILPDVHHVANFNQFYYGSPSFIPTLFKARRLIRAISPDILHAHFVHQYGWLGAFSGFYPFVLTAWGTDIFKLPYGSRGLLGKWLTQVTLKKADAITATSEAAKSKAIMLGAEGKKISVIFWGVDTKMFRPGIDTRQIRKQLAIADNAPVIFSNRNYAPLYNNDVIIKAMAQVTARYPDAILILQNAGMEKREGHEFKSMIAENGLEGSVRLLPQYGHDALPPLYALADIYVSVPTWDAGPVSLKEAMASHCTPIISDVSGPKEWVVHEKNGIIVPVRNVEKLAGAICELLADKGKRQRFNEINRKLMVEKADHMMQMKKAEATYERLLGF